MLRIASILTTLLLFSCGDTGGKDGLNGADGVNGTDGVDGNDGSDGVDGTDGEDGVDGTDGEDLMAEPESLSIVITDVSVAGPPVVSFEVHNQDGEPFNGVSSSLLSGRAMRFAIAQLVPGEDGSADTWQSYINTTETTDATSPGPDDVAVLAEAIQATTETSGTLTYLGDGLYTYTFAADVTAITSPVAVDYDEDLLHRVAMQIEYPLDSGEELIYNPTFDWVPSGALAPATRDIVSTASCNECHDQLAIHGGGRIETDYCVMCHNPGTTDANSGNTVDMGVMVHKIHMGTDLPSNIEGNDYTIWGYGGGEHDYSHVGYPQDNRNCIKCHDPADADTPDAANHTERPSMDACGSCHDDIDWATGENHTGGAMTSDSNCSVCHSSTSIATNHLTEHSTPHNPDMPTGLSHIEYELVSASVDVDNVLTVEFIINRDGSPIDCSNLDSDLSGAPTFLRAWAEATDESDAPTDWNNLGNKAGQPSTTSISSLVSGSITGGEHSYSGGVNTMVLADAFPEGATLRTVALQGYYTQTYDDESYGRYTISTFLTVDGDEARRVAADSASCSNCHEYFEAHGGNRVYETQVCAMCHNPSLSSSGRELDLDNPEASNNLKDLVHGIHGASVREDPLDFVRNRSGGTRYTFLGSEDQLEEYPDGHLVTYPASPSNCTMCHTDDTYMVESVPELAANSTWLVGDEAASTTEVADLRTSMPNDSDWIIGPVAAACSSCHDSAAAMAHMDHNGGAVLWTRGESIDEAPYEACVICHGEGSVSPVSEVHGIQ